MTEQSYQKARKIMQKANWLRSKIIIAKGNVSKWTAIESAHRENLQPDRAEAANKMILKCIDKLEEERKKFAELKFPE